MLQEFGPNIWTVDGEPITAAAGFHYPTRMAVIRNQSGHLFVCSPIALDDQLQSAVDTIGEVHTIVAPNTLHHMFVDQWAKAYPNARFLAAPGLPAKRPDLTFQATLGNEPEAHWLNDIEQVVMAGNRITTEVVFFHKESRTVLFTDLLQQLPPTWFTGWRRVVAKLDLMTEAEPAVPRKFRIAFSNRRAARAALACVLEWPAEQVLMAHGTPVRKDGQTFLRRAFRWLGTN